MIPAQWGADLSRAICSVTAHSRAFMGPGKAVMKTPSFSWHSYPLHTNSVARTVAQYKASAISPTSLSLAARSLYLSQQAPHDASTTHMYICSLMLQQVECAVQKGSQPFSRVCFVFHVHGALQGGTQQHQQGIHEHT